MIKQEITMTIGESEYTGDLNVPSVVLTSTTQEEELDLTKSPNFQITINDNGDITDTVEVVFTAEKVDYTANMKVVNRNGDFVTLQYVDGLTAEDVPEQSVAPTITYNNETFTVSATGEGTVKMYVDGVETVSPHTFNAVGTYVVTATAQQDGKTISETVTENITIVKTAAPTISYDDSTFTVSASGQGTVKMYVDGVETVSPHTFTQGQSDVTYVVTATAIETGKLLSDTVTENCLVTAAAQPAGVLHFTSPENGAHIEGEADPVTHDYDIPVKVVYANGESVPYDIVLGVINFQGYQSGTCEEGGVTVACVRMSEGDEGELTLTFTDPDTHETCETTFTFNITAQVHTYTVAGTEDIFGSNWDPTDENNDMNNDIVDDNDNQYSWKREGMQIDNPSTAEFKIAQDHSWTNSWPARGNVKLNNWGVTAPGVYNIEIYFSADTQEISVIANALRFISPEYGAHIEETADPATDEYNLPIEVVYANGESVPYDITMTAVTSENYSTGSYEDEGGVSGVFVSLPVGEGTDTLTFTDPETEETCTTTFTYNITAPEPEPEEEPGE